MKRRKSPSMLLAASMRRVAREQYVADLREGRRQRAITIPSGKTYKRRAKHVGKEQYPS